MITKYLKEFFNYDNFRNGQEEIIQSILAKNDTVVIMPTGGGKSLCYQIPALMLEGTALVISPLIALMKDQYDSLEKKNFPATYINSALPADEISERLNKAQKGEYKLIYIAPERLESEYFLKILSQLNISFLAVDEAHCVSEWGHDFRPAYLNIRKALESIKISHTVALTATATKIVQEDIAKILLMKNPKFMIKGFDRENLTYITEEINEKTSRIIEILQNTQEGSTIIYCGSRKKTESIYKELKSIEIPTTIYHAGIAKDERKKNQEMFIEGEANVIVATNAFGMGIDKSNVRNVIHTDFTGSIEAYYQEAGRAGRDGKLAYCYLLYNSKDTRLQEFFIDCAYPPKEDFAKVHQFLFAQETEIINKSDMEIGNSLKIPMFKVSSILNYFEKLKIIEKINNPKNAKIKFLYEKKYLLAFAENTNESNRKVMNAFVRAFSNDAMWKFVDFDTNFLIKKYELTQKEISSALKNFQRFALIDFQADVPENSIMILDSKKEIDINSEINYKRLQKRKKYLFQKFEKMLDYVRTTSCKRNFILEYFNDTYEGNCEKCSSCISAKDGTNIKIFEPKNIRMILSAAAELNGKFGRYLLAMYLLGAKNDKIESYKLSKGKFYGKLRKYSLDDIYSEIDYCVENELLRITSGLYPLVLITNQGKLSLNETIKPLPIIYIKSSDTNSKNSSENSENNTVKSGEMNIAEKIDDYFRNGYTIEEIALMLKITQGKIAEIMQFAIEKSIINYHNHKHYINNTDYSQIKQVVARRPKILLRDIQEQLQAPINYALLRIIVAFIRQQQVTIFEKQSIG